MNCKEYRTTSIGHFLQHLTYLYCRKGIKSRRGLIQAVGRDMKGERDKKMILVVRSQYQMYLNRYADKMCTYNTMAGLTTNSTPTLVRYISMSTWYICVRWYDSDDHGKLRMINSGLPFVRHPKYPWWVHRQRWYRHKTLIRVRTACAPPTLRFVLRAYHAAGAVWHWTG